MAVGTRTMTAVALLAGSLFLLWNQGRFRPDYLAQLDPWVTLTAACCAVIAGTAAYRFLQLHERSEFGIGVFRAEPVLDVDGLPIESQKRGLVVFGRLPSTRVFELPPFALLLVTVLVCLNLGLTTLDNRAIALIADYPRRLDRSSAQFCPATDPEPQVDDSTQLGCELVRRAYRLGYAKSLGSCAPKEEDEQPPDICRLRQHDEPYLHYAWRLLNDRLQKLRTATSQKQLEAMVDRFEHQAGYVDILIRSHHDAVAVAKRSSHHLFTNLPDPRQTRRAQVDALLDYNRCVRQYEAMPHLLTDKGGGSSQGLILEHVIGQLLFNPGYKSVVGYCQEFTVHYEAPTDACKRLAKNPNALLEEYGALETVTAIVERYMRQQITRELGIGTGARTSKGSTDATMDRIVSFQCLIVDPASSQEHITEHVVKIDGETLLARELRVAAIDTDVRGQIELYKHLATLVAPGFGYGRLVSRAAVGGDAAPREESSDIQASEQLDGSRYTLTQLEFLRDTDLFLGHEWIDERPDLLEVYPYHVHLTNFIEVFRNYYQRHRGRL